MSVLVASQKSNTVVHCQWHNGLRAKCMRTIEAGHVNVIGPLGRKGARTKLAISLILKGGENLQRNSLSTGPINKGNITLQTWEGERLLIWSGQGGGGAF